MEEIAHGESVEDMRKKCPKKMCHEQYKKVKDFTKECLPAALRDDQVLVAFIDILTLLSVKIAVWHEEGDTYGTGFITHIRQEGDTLILVVATALHVLEKADKTKLQNCRLFLDEAIKAKERKLHCTKIHAEDEKGDWCELYFDLREQNLADTLHGHSDHFWELGRMLKEKYEDKDKTDVIIVGYPHGGEKVISTGNLHQTSGKKIKAEVRDNQDKCVFSYNCPTCPGMSGALVYVLGRWIDGYGYWFGHFHHHSEGGKIDNEKNLSTDGVESTLIYQATA